MNDILFKVQKASKTASIILKILYIFCIVGFCISFVSLIWLFVSPSVNNVEVLRFGGTAVKIGIPVANVVEYQASELIILLIAGIVSLVFDFLFCSMLIRFSRASAKVVFLSSRSMRNGSRKLRFSC